MMTEENFHFQIGNYKCLAINDGYFRYSPPTFPLPSTFLFANAQKQLLKHTLRKHGLQHEFWFEWVSSYNCVIINTGKNKVLVDTGAGSLGSNTGNLLLNMHSEGISPSDIDTVILTHGHPDHIGGNVDSEGKPTFPNARYVMWKKEWEYWASEISSLEDDEHFKETLRKVASNNLPTIQDQLDLVDREAEIVPGITAIEASGHTPGHMALTVSSGDECLLCISDAVLHPIHVEQPTWYAAIDFSPEQVEKTRHKLFMLVKRRNALVLAFHFPFPGLGHILKKGEQSYWQRI